jgi:hypothetical protein
MQLVEYGKGVFGLYIWMQESKCVFVFSVLIIAENKIVNKSVRKLFLMIGPGFMGSLVYSLLKSWWH